MKPLDSPRRSEKGLNIRFTSMLRWHCPRTIKRFSAFGLLAALLPAVARPWFERSLAAQTKSCDLEWVHGHILTIGKIASSQLKK
ncbi:MAG: hypothetical protein M2R45_03623 [Verrucomicrobia subdivision 3 bacterium]|nr:hypothetical protein [Limisphaerales bacterium]MCS1416882.1 hypothetical protein [Limisphaerales bacterium]